MAADQRQMWINALNLIGEPTDRYAADVGREFIRMIKDSMRPDRKRAELEPIGHVVIEVSAS